MAASISKNVQAVEVKNPSFWILKKFPRVKKKNFLGNFGPIQNSLTPLTCPPPRGNQRNSVPRVPEYEKITDKSKPTFQMD